MRPCVVHPLACSMFESNNAIKCLNSAYGTIADLDEEELADPDELEHQVFLQE
jgi:hypothetical protein